MLDRNMPLCDRLEQIGFSAAASGVHKCYDGHDVVPYSHA